MANLVDVDNPNIFDQEVLDPNLDPEEYEKPETLLNLNAAAATAEVQKLFENGENSKLIEDLTAEKLEKEKEDIPGKIKEVIEKVEKRVDDVLKNSRKTVKNALERTSKSVVAAGIDRLLYKTHADGRNSLTVEKAELDFLNETKNSVTAQWNEVQATQRAIIEKYGDLPGVDRTALYAGLGLVGAGIATATFAPASITIAGIEFATHALGIGATAGLAGATSLATGGVKEYLDRKSGNRQKRAETKAFEAFSEGFTTELADLFQDRTNDKNSSIKKIEGRVEKTRKVMQSQITLADSEKKEKMFDQIEAATTADTLDGFDISIFGLDNSNEQLKINFLEVIKSQDFKHIRESLEVIGLSKARFSMQEGLQDSANEQERVLKTGITSIELKTVRKIGRSNGVEPEKGVSTADLYSAIIGELKTMGLFEAFERSFPGNLKKDELLTSPVKLKIILEEIFTEKGGVRFVEKFDKKVYAKIFGWFEETNGTIEKPFRNAELDDRKTEIQKVLKNGTTLFDEAMKFGDLETDDYEKFQEKLQKFNNNCIDKRAKFQSTLENLKDTSEATDELAELGEIWQKITDHNQSLLEKTECWIRDKKEWKKNEEKRVKLQEKVDEAERMKKGTTKDSQKAHADRVNLAIRNRDKFENTVKFSAYEGGVETGNFFKEKSAKLKIDAARKIEKEKERSGAEKFKGFQERVYRKLHREFEQEMEEKWLGQMEKNDQFDLLQKVAPGARVSISYKNAAILEEISLPSDIKNGVENEEFRVIGKGKNGTIELQNNDHIIRIAAPTIKNGEVVKNARVYDKSPAGSGKSPTNPDVAKNKQPAIILNMQIH